MVPPPVAPTSILSISGVRPISVFFFNDTATTEIYTLSLHDALPISFRSPASSHHPITRSAVGSMRSSTASRRSEEHTSELQSQSKVVCRPLLEKKNSNLERANEMSRPREPWNVRTAKKT